MMHKENKKIKLNLGCGKVIIPGFVNADIVQAEGVDVIVDINDLEALKQYDWYGNVDLVYLSHVLEHFPTAKIPSLLKNLYDLLGEGGRVRISVPDLDKMCRLYVKNIDWFKPPHNPWLGLIYGGQIDEFDFHKTGYNFPYLQCLLVEAGFSHVIEIRGSDDLGVFDASQSCLPFGDISITVEATKGGTVSSLKRFRYTPVESFMSFFADGLIKLFFVLIRARIALIRRRINRPD